MPHVAKIAGQCEHCDLRQDSEPVGRERTRPILKYLVTDEVDWHEPELKNWAPAVGTDLSSPKLAIIAP